MLTCVLRLPAENRGSAAATPLWVRSLVSASFLESVADLRAMADEACLAGPW